MKLKNSVFEQPGFIASINKIATSSIPALAAFKLLKVVRVLEPENRLFVEAKNNLISKYGEEEDGMLRIAANSSNYGEFMTEYCQILEEEFDIPIDEKIKVSVSKIKGNDGSDIMFSVPELAAVSEIIDLED